jgi:hypothetical protein
MSDNMREEFEAFYESYMLGEGRRIEYIKNEIASFRPERNKYGYSDAQEFWVVWKASRAAMVKDVAIGEWTDEQCSEFLSIALRRCDVRGRIAFDEIRQGVSAANSLAPKP